MKSVFCFYYYFLQIIKCNQYVFATNKQNTKSNKYFFDPIFLSFFFLFAKVSKENEKWVFGELQHKAYLNVINQKKKNIYNMKEGKQFSFVK